MDKFVSPERDSISQEQQQSILHPFGGDVQLRAPSIDDGYRIHKLVSQCPPLDLNSRYCYLLQCTDFADTCVLADDGKRIVGWVSGYRRPSDPSTLFIWQVAVHEDVRGQSLAKRLMQRLLTRPNCRDITMIQSSITAENHASLGVFMSLAESLDARLVHREWLQRDEHFYGCQASELLLTIGPFETRDAEPIRAPRSARQQN